MDGLRAGFAPLQFSTELVILRFELPAAEMDDRPEAFQGGLKLLLGGLLAVASLLHAAHQERPFGVAQLFHGGVVGRLTTGQHQHGEHQQSAGTDARVGWTTHYAHSLFRYHMGHGATVEMMPPRQGVYAPVWRIG